MAGGDSLYKYSALDIDGKETKLSKFEGKYAGLQKLYEKYEDDFVVLAFPCNQFGKQEPGSEAEIKAFVADKYGVTFPMFSKIDVKGPEAHPIYKFLQANESDDVGWNFFKFLVNKEGEVVGKRHSNRVTPEDLDDDIAALVG